MGIIGWILLGLFAGLLAKLILPRDQPGGLIVTTLIGVAGALIAGFSGKALGFGDPIDEFFDLSTWVAAIIGSVLLLLLWGAIAGSRGAQQGRLTRPSRRGRGVAEAAPRRPLRSCRNDSLVLGTVG